MSSRKYKFIRKTRFRYIGCLGIADYHYIVNEIQFLIPKAIHRLKTIRGGLDIINKMPQFIEVRGTEYWIENPVMHEENFADKWNEVPKKRTAFMCWIQKAKKDLITDPLSCFGQDGIANQYKQVLGKTPVERAACAIGNAEFKLVDDDGAVVAESGSVQPGQKAKMTIYNPQLWSPENPKLYTLRAVLEKNSTIRDEVEIPVGIRTISFDADKGFFINERATKIKGVCLHHDVNQ